MSAHFRRIELSRRLYKLEALRRVALVTGNYLNVIDGAAMTVHRMVSALESLGVEVAVIAPRGDHDGLSPAHQMIHVPSLGLPIQKGYRLSLGLDSATVAKLERFDPQVVHVATPDLAGVMALRYARRRDLVLTSTYHTNFASYLKYWGLIPSALTPLAWELTKRFYAPFDRVYVPTDSLGEELIRRGVLERYSILARGVDPDKFHRGYRSRHWRIKNGIGEEEIVVLFCARIVWEKGLRTLVKGLEILRQQGLAHRVLIVGEGDQRKWLQERLPEAVFTGYLVDEELSRAYASADIFVYPSTTDTFGNVTLEAMSSHLPVIGARAPGTRCIVEDGQSGILVEPDDAKALAEAMALLITDVEERRRLAWGAARRASQFRWDEILARFVLDLDGLVA